MTKRLNSKHKVDRRLKVNLWGRPKSPFNKRAYSPGQHGQSKTSKPSNYGIQLQAKQKLKSYYGNINERQFRNLYKKAIMKKGDTAENLIGFLESLIPLIITLEAGFSIFENIGVIFISPIVEAKIFNISGKFFI